MSTGWSYDTNTNDRRLIGISNSGVTRSYTLSYLNGSSINPYDIMSITDTAATGHPWATQCVATLTTCVDRLLTASCDHAGQRHLRLRQARQRDDLEHARERLAQPHLQRA